MLIFFLGGGGGGGGELEMHFFPSNIFPDISFNHSILCTRFLLPELERVKRSCYEGI